MTDLNAQQKSSLPFGHKKEYGCEVDESQFRKLCVKNIATATTEQELLKLFMNYGFVEKLKLKVNINIGPYAKYAVVLFGSHREAKNCIERINGYILNGRPLRIDLQKYTGRLEEEGESYYSFFSYKSKFGSGRNYRNNIRPSNSLHGFSRYPNNKRVLKNDGSYINDNGKNCTNAGFYQHREPTKRVRYSPGLLSTLYKEKANLGAFLNNSECKIRKYYPDFNLKEFLMKHGGEKLVDSLYNNDVNSEVILLVKQLIKELLKKPQRVKLMLCEHLKECTNHIFVRPTINVPVDTTVTYGTDDDNSEDGPDLDILVGNYNASDDKSTQNVDKKGNLKGMDMQRDSFNCKTNMVHNNFRNTKETNGIYNMYNNKRVNSNTMEYNNLDPTSPTVPLHYEYDPACPIEDKAYTWSGVLEMRNKEKMRLIGYPLQNDEHNFLNTNITHIYITHRKKMNGLPANEAVYFLELLDKNDQEVFNSYRDYFSSKERVGLAATDQGWYIYIVFPGCPTFEQFCPYKTECGIVALICFKPHNEELICGAPTKEQNEKEGLEQEKNSNEEKDDDSLPNSASNGQFSMDNIKQNENMLTDQIDVSNTIEHTNESSQLAVNAEKKDDDIIDESKANLKENEVVDSAINPDVNSEIGKDAPNENSSLANNYVEKETEKTGEINTEEEIPKWLNQFSSLAAYLVKK